MHKYFYYTNSTEFGAGDVISGLVFALQTSKIVRFAMSIAFLVLLFITVMFLDFI